jgi:DNA-directed RNA polymerase subunit omega
MARITVEDCLERVENRFALVHLVAKRAKQLLKGSSVTVAAKSNKYIVSALREVSAGTVFFENAVPEVQDKQIEEDLNR